MANGTISHINDYFYDELLWDRQPTSRHVYSGVAYIAEKNELILTQRRLWRYSLDQHKWIFKIIPGANSPSDPVGSLGEEAIAYYDQSRDQMLTLSCGFGGPWSDIFNFSNNRWAGESVYGVGWDLNGAMDYRWNNHLQRT